MRKLSLLFAIDSLRATEAVPSLGAGEGESAALEVRLDCSRKRDVRLEDARGFLSGTSLLLSAILGGASAAICLEKSLSVAPLFARSLLASFRRNAAFVLRRSWRSAKPMRLHSPFSM